MKCPSEDWDAHIDGVEREQIDEYRRELQAMVPAIIAGILAHPDHPTHQQSTTSEVLLSDLDAATRAIRIASHIIGGVANEAHNPGSISGDDDPDSTILNHSKEEEVE